MDRPTAAFPPPAPRLPDTSAATLMAAGPIRSSVAASATDTLVDDSRTLAAPGTSSPRTLPSTTTRGFSTVLPDVHTRGEELVMVPRDKTRYESAKLLGRGGMGEVKLAQDHDIGRKVAVKRLLDEGNAHAVARFIDEVRTVGSLEHPNIVPIHDVGVDEDGALFFVMKYVEGETLASIIEKLAAGDRDYHSRYGFERRLDLFAGLLRALQYAHSQGLVHRDVKPENVMVGRYGEVILMDWGIAHWMRAEGRPAGPATTIDRASSETLDGAIVGTPQYMSPEQSLGEVAELDGRSDLYSAFVVLWELLTLTPYIAGGKSAMQILVEVHEREAPSTFHSAYDHPAQAAVASELRHYLRHGLQRRKEDRFADADEALYDLERARSGDFAIQCPVTFMKHFAAKAMRFTDAHPLLAMLFSGLTLTSTVGGIAALAVWIAG